MLSASGSRSRLSVPSSLPSLAEAPSESHPDPPARPARSHGAQDNATLAAESEYTSLLALVELLREAEGEQSAGSRRRQRLRRTVRLEDTLIGLARVLHNAGCPAWRIQEHLKAAARGLGLWPLFVHVFPHHVTFTFSRFLSADSAGAKTLSASTSPGLDIAGLDLADALARRLSSFAITSTSQRGGASVARNGEGEESEVAAAVSLLAPKWRGQRPAALAAAVLDAASKGPGFFHDGGDDSESSSSDEDEDEDEESSHLLSSPRRPRELRPWEGEEAEEEGGGEERPGARRRDAFENAALDEALATLKTLTRAPPLYSSLSQCAASAIAAAGCALVFWNASWYDGSLAAACGGLVGLLGLLFYGSWGSRSGLRRVAGYELVSAFMVSFLCRIAMHFAALDWSPGVCAPAVRLGALQWLLQGWDLTAAIVELTNRNAAVVGASHLLVALTITAMIGFGLDLGDALADVIHLQTPADGGTGCSAGISQTLYLPVFLPAALALCVQMNAAPSQVLHMTVIALATLAITLYLPGSLLLNTLVAAGAAGYMANTYANRTGRPAVGGAAIGVFVLVPDGMSELNGVGAVMFDSTKGGSSMPLGLSLTASVLQSSVAIGAGLFVASLLLSPRELSHVSAARHHAQQAGGAGGSGGRMAWLRRALNPTRRRRAAYARSRALPLFF